MRPIVTIIMALAAALVLSTSYAGDLFNPEPVMKTGNAAVADTGPFMTAQNIYVSRTCSGEVAKDLPEIYVFGLNDQYGGCDVRTYRANDYEEALACAEKSCPYCRIEDLTWLNRFSTSTLEVNDINNYCPARK